MSEPRPDLVQEPCKPDVLVRLRGVSSRLPRESVDDIISITDAIDVIKRLRASDARRLTMIADLKRELAELRPSEGR